MRKNYLLLLMIFNGITSWSQQDPLLTQFWNTNQFFNPASTGAKYFHEAHALARWQWIGINGAPDSQLASYAAKLGKIKSGLGLVYFHEHIGLVDLHRIKMDFAYHLPINDKHTLSFGLAPVVSIININGEWITPTTANDSNISQQSRGTDISGDVGVIFSGKRLNLGLSTTQLIESELIPFFTLVRHFYFIGSYRFGNEDGIEITPQIMYRTDFNFQSMDFNTLFSYKSKYLLGLTYRRRDSFAFTGGYTLKKKYTVSYSYDLTISALNNGLSKGSHEFHLGYRF